MNYNQMFQVPPHQMQQIKAQIAEYHELDRSLARQVAAYKRHQLMSQQQQIMQQQQRDAQLQAQHQQNLQQQHQAQRARMSQGIPSHLQGAGYNQYGYGHQMPVPRASSRAEGLSHHAVNALPPGTSTTAGGVSQAAGPAVSDGLRAEAVHWRRTQHGTFFTLPANVPEESLQLVAWQSDVGGTVRHGDTPIVNPHSIVAEGDEAIHQAALTRMWAIKTELRDIDRTAEESASQIRKLEKQLIALKAFLVQIVCKKKLLGLHNQKQQQQRCDKMCAEMLYDRKRYKRTKRQTKKEVKAYEREQQKKLHEKEEAKRTRYSSYLKAITTHQDKFMKYHRQRKLDATRFARQARAYLEAIAQRAEKEEVAVERKRLTALRDNDMEAYSKLVEETKNERLQFLLEHTDHYIQEIRDKVNSEAKAAGKQHQDTGARGVLDDDHIELLSPRGEGRHDYFRSTHVKLEDVRQPQSLTGGELKEYQIQGLQWMVSLYNNNLNGILADEMGLGKTIQTIALLAYVMEMKHNRGPFLVVVPLSTLSNWMNEFRKWAPSIIVVVYKGQPQTRRDIVRDEMESGQYNVLLTTYEYIMKDKAVLKKPYWQYIIVDEGHRMKNANSKFAQVLGRDYQSRNRILLTGTPLQNNLPELWALLNFLLPSVFSSVDSFDNWFNQPFASFRGVGGGSTQAAQGEDQQLEITAEERMLVINRLHELLRPFMLRRVKASVLGQLPDKVEKVLRCELSGWQKQIYKQIQSEGAAAVNPRTNGGLDNGKGLSNMFMQLRKVCNHPYLFYADTWPLDMDLIRAAGKFELLDRMLQKLKAGGHRVLMFSQMTQAMDILEDFFTMRGFKYLRLDGSTSSEEREQRMYQFNTPDSPYFIFILSTRAGGLGLNLATADTVLIFDSDWNPMMDAQAQDRAHRIGQKNEVRVFRLITCSPIEERVLSRASDKLNNIGLVVEAGKFNKDSKASDRRQMLETLLREMDDQEGGAAEDSTVPDDEQINEMMAHTDEELRLYAKMDAEREAAEAFDGRGGKRLLDATERPQWIVSMVQAAEEEQARAARAAYDSEEEEGYSRSGRKTKMVDYSNQDKEWERAIRGDPDAVIPSLTNGKGSKRSLAAGPGGSANKKGKAKDETRGAQSSPAGTSVLADSICAKLVAINKLLKDAEHGEDPEHRKLCQWFMVRPGKHQFEGYYDVIKKPMDVRAINSAIKNKTYRTLNEFEADWKLIFDNARLYNESYSPIVEDANLLQEMLVSEMSALRKWCLKNGFRQDGTATGRESTGGAAAVPVPRIRKKSSIVQAPDSEEEEGEMVDMHMDVELPSPPAGKPKPKKKRKRTF